MKEMKLEIADDVIVYNPIIKKIWDACIKHGYILQRKNYLGSSVNRITLTS
jgi:hypothetical protein